MTVAAIASELSAPIERVFGPHPERAVRLEGGLFGPDILERLQKGELKGQKPAEFGISGTRSVLDKAAEVYSQAKKLWRVFQSRREGLLPDDPATTLTRDRWVIPFLELLDYKLNYNARAYSVDGVNYAISHRAGERDDAPPVHIVGVGQELGRVDPRGGRRVSPHSLMQEFLNRSEHLWGIVTNGLILRLLRKSSHLRDQAYVEFDLKAIFNAEGDAFFSDFVLLYRLLHRSRLPEGIADGGSCYLEKYYQEAIETGNRAREHLRESVEQCIKWLGTGFVRANSTLPYGKSNLARELYRDLLRLVYRFLFLLVAEERGLIQGTELYKEHYSITRLRRLADRPEAFTDDSDLWCSLSVLWHILRGKSGSDGKPLASLLGLSVLGGELFNKLKLEDLTLSNRDLLKAFYYLSYYQDGEVWRRISYAALDTEELGSVYESLLDHAPCIDNESGLPEFKFDEGEERIASGIYYTPPELVQELIKSALEPVLEEKLKGVNDGEARKKAILSMKVIDPACGSGHFLLAAARRLGKELAQVQTGEEEPSREQLRSSLREVIAHCIYGVDKNELAVELCKVALWIESHVPGKPLTFLDHQIRCGDSLVGVFDLNVLKQGIPEAALKPIRHERIRDKDDEDTADKLKQRNAKEKKAVGSLFDGPIEKVRHKALTLAIELMSTPDNSLDDLAEKAKCHEELRKSLEDLRCAANLWTAAFYQELKPGRAAITSEAVYQVLGGQLVDPRLKGLADELAERFRFFHWHLEFPEVFEEGGFDVVLSTPGRAQRVKKLPEENPSLYDEFQQEVRNTYAQGKFLRNAGRYKDTSRGHIDTFGLFCELSLGLVKPQGRAGLIVPTIIATGERTSEFLAGLVKSGRLVSLYDFENRAKFFPDFGSHIRFCLLTMSGQQRGGDLDADYAFFLTDVKQLQDENRRIRLSSKDLALFNPNTLTCPIFRTRRDFELNRQIYSRTPVLLDERRSSNPWKADFLLAFQVAGDSGLFRPEDRLEEAGFRLLGNRFVKGDEIYLPLYEGKLVWFYDHRFATYKTPSEANRLSEDEHADPTFLIMPRYWVPAKEVEKRLTEKRWSRDWLMVWRDIARATDKRTVIPAIIPRVGVGSTLRLMMPGQDAILSSCLLADQASIVHDYVARQKVGGAHVALFIMKQLPTLEPSTYTSKDILFIVPRVLELVYTAWDIKAFADDVWMVAGGELRDAIRRQWEENADSLGNLDPTPPCWAEIKEGGIPFAPFKWSEERRIVLLAELDEYYAKLYGLSPEQLRYILAPADSGSNSSGN